MARASRRIGLREVRALAPGEIAWDSEVRGFAARRQQSETVSFVLSYRTAEARQRWLTIGAFGSPWSVEDARKEARRLLSEVVKGADPAAAKKERRTAVTVAELCRGYMEDAEKGKVLNKQGEGKKPSTLLRDHSRINAHILPLLGNIKVNAISQKDIREYVHAVIDGKVNRKVPTGKLRGVSNVRGGKGAAARSLGLLGAIFAYGVEQGACAANPCIGVRRPADGTRERRLADAEYAGLAAGLQAVVETPRRAPMPAPAVACARFLALTGWRTGEAVNLRWAAVDLAGCTATLADTKTGKSLRPLSKAAVKLLSALPRNAGAVHVFPAAKADEPMTGFAKAFGRIIKAGELSDEITPQVLRHSFASLAADLGYSDATIASLIGHKGGGITRRYIHTADAVLLGAADAVADETLKRMNNAAKQLSN